MSKDNGLATVVDGDLVQLQGIGYKSHIIKLKTGAELQTHRGVIRHDDIIGQPWGSRLLSHTGNPFYLLQPGLSDIIKDIKRTTQIMYPKDIGYLLLTLGIGPGKKVLEAGTGSGGLTTAFAYMVGSSGHVYSYDRKPEVQALAKTNLSRTGLDEFVSFKLGDAALGFDERNMDAVFLDLPNPYDFILQAKKSLKPGGYLGIIVPTVNQVGRVLPILKNEKFIFVEVCEILIRFFKTDWERIRPTDRMVAHTGYLIYGRSVLDFEDDDIEAEAEN